MNRIQRMDRPKSGIRRVTGGQRGQKRGTRRQSSRRLIDAQTRRHAPTVTEQPTRPRSVLDPRVSYGRVALPAPRRPRKPGATARRRATTQRRGGDHYVDKPCVQCRKLMHHVWPNRQRCADSCSPARTRALSNDLRRGYRADRVYREAENRREAENKRVRYRTDAEYRERVKKYERERHAAKK